jgi:hypothetical protein
VVRQMRKRGICKAHEMIFSHKVRSVLPLSHADKWAEIFLSFAVICNNVCALQFYEDASY